jgi:hypothetical protein
MKFGTITGKIVVVNIDPNDKPSNSATNPRNWHKQIASIATTSGSVEGIDATSDPKYMVFTHRYNEPNGFVPDPTPQTP